MILLALFALAAHAEIPSWLQWLPTPSPAISILYRMVPTIAGPTLIRRPPRETAPELATHEELAAITAREYEAQLDFANAEAQWKRSGDAVALADYHHRRMQPQQELASLVAVESVLPAIDDALQAPTDQQAWKIHERIQDLIQAEAMPTETAIQDYEAWLTKYPQAASVYQRYFDFLTTNNLSPQASRLLDRYQRTFPSDRVFPIRAKTSISATNAIAIYDGAFDPLWPPELLDGYFKLLTDSHTLFDFYQAARRDANAQPLSLTPAGRLFHYYRKQLDPAAARRELAEFRIRKETALSPWTADELRTLAALSDLVNDHDEVIRYSYALYSLPGADAASVEGALARIISTLLKAPDQPIRFGQGNLSFYRDIATIDQSPGFLNGILSLIFNSQYPDSQFNTQDAKSEAYFHRARADELYTLLSNRFPLSTRRSELLSALIEGYAIYGEDDAIIRKGTAFISEFADAEQRTRVALQVADAYARRRQVPEELAVYDRLLTELAAKSQQVPSGATRPRSPDYAQVLQRYISRLTQLERIPDALVLYRREIDRNPNDPGLYDRLADFLGANQRSADIEQVYRGAIQRFQDPSWSHKLARFYLRTRLANQLQALSREVVDTFSGADLEAYMADVVADGSFERRLQLDINLYAHTRFPHDLTFVHNLISLYSSGATTNAAALSRLLSDHWYEDESIRRMYFERLAVSGSLTSAIQTATNLLPSNVRGRWTDAEAENPAVTRFIAEAESWQSHFEAAAPIMRAVAEAYPADSVFAGRATDVYRSLAGFDASNTSVAVSIAERLSISEPRNRARLIRVGEIYADRELMAPAVGVWNRLGLIEPGKPEGYLEAATLFWDYFRPADALEWLRRGRVQLKNPTLWTYETGAIFESQGRREDAVREYIAGALAGRSSASNNRLLRLAPRPEYKKLIDDQTRIQAEKSSTDPDVLDLRVNVLRAQQRTAELEPLLQRIVNRTSSREILAYVRRVADETAMPSIQERVLRRETEIESDTQQQLRLRIQLAHFLEAGGQLGAAQREMESVYKANPLISGVIRAMTDYYWRHDKPRAIRVLAAAAERAHPSVRNDYFVEMVRKSIDAMRYPDAMQAAQNLLRIDPINGSFIALMADALAAGGRDAEVQQLYASKIPEIQQSAISQAEKTNRIAAMRRGLIPVYVRLGKFREALDQYIEIINRFPDDTNILAEAGRLAAQHNLKPVLVSYYADTVEKSPRDPRWSIVLARVHTQFEDYPAAIEAYTKAMAARPERQDLATARADLEERTFRFAEAIATYSRIHELSHGKPVWLERIAVLQARLGQSGDAIGTLRRAYIDNRPESSREYARVGLLLEQVGLVNEAADFMQQQAAGTSVGSPGWEADYARIMTRARRYAEALPRTLAIGLRATQAMGRAAAEYFTPEERTAFETLLSSRQPASTPMDRPRYLEVANFARLYDLEMKWRLEQASNPDGDRGDFQYGNAFNLQQRRMQFTALGRDAETLASRSTSDDDRRELLATAMQAYRSIGDSVAELQLFARHNELQINYRQRHYALLASSQPDRLLAIAARTPADSLSLLATQALVEAGDSMRALQAVRSQDRNPVWADAYSSLIGVHFGVNSPEIQSAFQRELGSQVIEERIATPVDRTRQLAGDIWFYYGQRYGEYLQDSGQSQAASDYLASQVESRPGDPDAYQAAARYYRQLGQPERALTEFRHVLELNPNRPDIRSSIAVLLWDAGRRNDASAEWKAALSQLTQAPQAGAGSVVLRDIRSRQQADALKTDIDAAFRASARELQSWQLPELLQALFENSSNDPWFMSLVQVSTSPGQLLMNLAGQTWLSDTQQGSVLQTAVSVFFRSSAANRFDYQQIRLRYLEYLVGRKDAVTARQVLATFTDAERRNDDMQQVELRIAALEGKLEPLLEHYRQNPSDTPADFRLQEAGAALAQAGLINESQRVLEFLYSHQIEVSGTNTGAFLGLSEIRLKQGRTAEAVDLLKRLNLLSTIPFDNQLASARLLAAAGHPLEAMEFLRLRVQAVPWDDDARLELARVQFAVNADPAAASANLQNVAGSTRALYDTRTQAAREQAIHSAATATAGSRELDLLSKRLQLTPDVADTPHFFAARIVAAEQSSDLNVRVGLLLDAVAERPDDPTVRKLLFFAALQAKQNHQALAVNRRSSIEDSATAVGMAEANLQLGAPSEAARYFGIAASKEEDPASKQVLMNRQKQATADAERIIENERRRPVIRAELDQPEAVQRRLP